mgnify:CR=1 FL=1
MSQIESEKYKIHHGLYSLQAWKYTEIYSIGYSTRSEIEKIFYSIFFSSAVLYRQIRSLDNTTATFCNTKSLVGNRNTS